jgi:hypothetical protein
LHIPVGDRPHPHLLMSSIPPWLSDDAHLLRRKSPEMNTMVSDMELDG